MLDRIWIIERINHTTGSTRYKAYTSFERIHLGIRSHEKEIKELQKKGQKAEFRVWKTGDTPDWVPFDEDVAENLERISIYEELKGLNKLIEDIRHDLGGDTDNRLSEAREIFDRVQDRMVTNKGGHPNIHQMAESD